MGLCLLCWGDGVVDKGTKNERECPLCCGTGFGTDDDDDREEDGYED